MAYHIHIYDVVEKREYNIDAESGREAMELAMSMDAIPAQRHPPVPLDCGRLAMIPEKQ